ncbi:MAG: carboxypeptidase M32 [Erysipelotrichaceae bacterium]|nr:carboxypeptidase M32 [Erysipelotrichaceae bacterium]
MKNNKSLKVYKDTNKKLSAYSTLVATAYFDKDTVAPKKGNKARNEALALMSGEIYSIQTDKEYLDAVTDLKNQDLGFENNREIYLRCKSLQEVLKFSKEETMAYTQKLMNAQDSWIKAREEKDYKYFEKALLELIEITKTRLNRRNDKVDAYDLLLDDFQEGMNREKYDVFFNKIKEELIPLIKEVSNRQQLVDDSFLHKYYPADKQREFARILLKYLHFDRSWGYLGETEHPYTTTICEDDIRITTRYMEHDVSAALFSIIHEAGHAYYDHQVDKKYQNTMIHDGISMGVHESQSRFNENYIGKRRSFWVKLYPELVRIFPENLKDVSLDDFIRAINKSCPSFIRTEADELTYPIHILIRYEIEKGIFNGSIDLKDLPKIGNQKYKEYLGLDVRNDFEGILQDIHWSQASFGYFPTYALGSAIGAQLINQMEKELDIDALLEKGKYPEVQKWLKEKIQKYGALYTYDDLLKIATGKKFNPDHYIKYLKNKYKKLYKIR